MTYDTDKKLFRFDHPDKRDAAVHRYAHCPYYHQAIDIVARCSKQFSRNQLIAEGPDEIVIREEMLRYG